jgi:hypothetical protein
VVGSVLVGGWVVGRSGVCWWVSVVGWGLMGACMWLVRNCVWCLVGGGVDGYMHVVGAQLCLVFGGRWC